MSSDECRILAIGDCHFKEDNALETEILTREVVATITRLRPHLVVVLGDLLHTFGRLNVHPLSRAVDFLRQIRGALLSDKKTPGYLAVIVGNHDRPNNNVFLTKEHGLGLLEEWPRTILADTVKILDYPPLHPRRDSKGSVAPEEEGSDDPSSTGRWRFAFVPYVYPGRFAEALATVGLKPPYENIDLVFAHQEVKGAKMGHHASEIGDVWPEDAPLCVSGHIHDYDLLAPNFLYTGTPFQHGYAEKFGKSISFLTVKPRLPKEKRPEILHDRISLPIPRKICVRLSPEELSRYVPPPDAFVRIKVLGSSSVVREILQLSHVKELISRPGIKLSVDSQYVSSRPREGKSSAVVKCSFQERLNKKIEGVDPSLMELLKWSLT